MAKMFYSIDETAAKLGKSAAEVQELAASGKLQEFRDRDRLVFKVEQVDLLAHGSNPGFTLSDSKGGSGLELALEDSSAGVGGPASSGSGMEIDEGAKERSGISIFDTESTDDGDPSAVTRITPTSGAEPLSLESVGSGSGLLDLTREGDDTSLGADLLEDVYKSEDGGADTTGASGLFEPTSAASDVSPGMAAGMPAMAMMAAEPYDGSGSGLVGGAAFAAILITAAALVATVTGLIGSSDNPVVSMVMGQPMVWAGVAVGVLVFAMLVGWLLGKRTD